MRDQDSVARHVRVLQEMRGDLAYATRFARKCAALDYVIALLQSQQDGAQGGDAVALDMVPRSEMLAALADQRRRIGSENDEQSEAIRAAFVKLTELFNAAQAVSDYDWSENDYDAVAAIHRMRAALKAALATPAPAQQAVTEVVMYQHRVKSTCGERAGQWSLWGEVDREQYEYCKGHYGHEVRALGVLTGSTVTDEMVRRASLAYECEMEGCVYGPEAPESAMRSALKAALNTTAQGASDA